MASETLMHGHAKYYLPVFIAVSFSGAGALVVAGRFLPAGLLLLTGLASIWMIISLYDGTQEAIACFFESLKNDDTTLQFQTGIKNASLGSLYESMNRVNRHFQEIRIRSEFNEKYYRSLIRHSATGLIVLTAGNEIELMNEMACKYAGISPDTVNFRILKTKNPAFYEAVNSLKPGENITYKNIIHNNFQLLFFRATRVRKRDLTVKLVSIEDIRSEMESRELESYRKLISVLTHEIMNLLSPLTSVSKALRTLFYSGERPKKPSEIDEDTLKATLNGIQIIEEQSSGMMNFVSNYRKISKIPQPEMKEFLAQEWIEQIKIVFTESLASTKIRFDITADKVIRHIVADRKLINQVMINIINNAIDAIADQEGERMIRIRIFQNRMNRLLIEVFNNGPRIPPEMQEKIFVPFFTTKKHGSGIGLSISQEIMKLHKGSLRVTSNEEHGTTFILEL